MKDEHEAGMKANLREFGKVLFLIVLAYFCLTFLIPKWQVLQLSGRLETLSGQWLLAAWVFMVMQYLMMFFLWHLLLRVLGARPPLLPIFRAFAFSLLPKYVPGTVLAYGVRGRLVMQAGVPATTTVASLIWEAFFTLGSATVVSLLGLLYHPPVFAQDSLQWLVVACGVGVGFLLSPMLLGSRWKAWTGLSQLRGQSWVGMSLLFGLYISIWLIMGLTHWCLAQALTSLPTDTLFPFVIASALSWGLGYISFIAPAGLGVREGVLYFFVRSWMSEGDALLFVTLSRIMMFGAELLLTLTCWLYTTYSQRC